MAARVFFFALAALWIIEAVVLVACWWRDLPLGGGMTFAVVFASLRVAIDFYREGL